MKIIHVAFTVALLAVILSISSVYTVSALEQNEIEALTFKSDDAKVPGQIFGIRVLLNSTTTQELSIYTVGIHIDWMDTDELYGPNFSSDPVMLAAGEEYRLDIINFTVPIGTSNGAHTYFVGVDGIDEAGNAFSWTSAEETISIAASSSSSSPTTTPTTTNGNGQTTNNSWVTYLVIIAVAAALAVLIVIIIMKRRTTPHAVTESSADQSQSSAPSKPDEEQDFNI